MINKVGGRKFVFAILATILSFVLVLTNRVESREWLAFMGVVGGTYVLGNVGSRIMEK